MQNYNQTDYLFKLTSGMDISLLIFDHIGNCTFCNWLLKESLAAPPKTIIEFIALLENDPEARSILLKNFENMQINETFSKEISKKTSSRSKNIFKVLLVKLNKDDSNYEFAVKISDITYESNLLLQVETLSRQASAGQAAAGIAHEFNNILTAMLGWTQLAIRATKDNEPASSALETIENNTRRSQQITSALLSIAKPDNLPTENVSIAQELKNAFILLSFDLEAAQISVKNNIEDVPFCRCNATRLVQVFINIIKNALAATPARGSLTVSVKLINKDVHIIFEDTGNGIPKNIMDKIFIPFFSTKAKYLEASQNGNNLGGNGLGLSICKKIIEDFGGSISITSKRPGGTTVTISLPVSEDICENDVLNDDSNNRSSFPPGIAVLVVDDEPDIGEMIRTALSLRGAHVVVATNGNDALELCKKELFNAAFLDFSMQGLSGHELSKAISKAQPNVPIVFMSGIEIPPNSHPAHSDFLKKPFDLNEIQMKLNEILERN